MKRFTDRSVRKITAAVRIVLKNRGRRNFRASPRTTSAASIRRAKTQEAAQADLNISVKFIDGDAVEFGDAFDAVFIDADGVTAANAALPRVATGKIILIATIANVWYVVNPTLIKSSPCS